MCVYVHIYIYAYAYVFMFLNSGNLTEVSEQQPSLKISQGPVELHLSGLLLY